MTQGMKGLSPTVLQSSKPSRWEVGKGARGMPPPPLLLLLPNPLQHCSPPCLKSRVEGGATLRGVNLPMPHAVDSPSTCGGGAAAAAWEDSISRDYPWRREGRFAGLLQQQGQGLDAHPYHQSTLQHQIPRRGLHSHRWTLSCQTHVALLAQSRPPRRRRCCRERARVYRHAGGHSSKPGLFQRGRHTHSPGGAHPLTVHEGGLTQMQAALGRGGATVGA